MGIDFTFGYFTAVDSLAKEILNLLADAQATQRYFIVETMGRSAGWLAYGAAIAGEASLVISVEDLQGKYLNEEKVDREGKTAYRPVMNLEKVVDRIVATMLTREVENKDFGVIVLAEGLAEYLPQKCLENIDRDEHGHISISEVNLAKMISRLVEKEYTRRTGGTRKITTLQLGYESRCVRPHAYDVLLGSQLGVGAFRALVERGLDGIMVSVSGQLELRFVPFGNLIDPNTLKTVVRYVKTDSDFHYLARFMETYVQDEQALSG
jgi:6-phosphofructokinase 1